jgi:hypothetical protein
MRKNPKHRVLCLYCERDEEPSDDEVQLPVGSLASISSGIAGTILLIAGAIQHSPQEHAVHVFVIRAKFNWHTSIQFRRKSKVQLAHLNSIPGLDSQANPCCHFLLKIRHSVSALLCFHSLGLLKTSLAPVCIDDADG